MGRTGHLLSLLAIAISLVCIPGRAAVEPPVPVRMVAPDFPYEMKRAGISGVVTLSFEVDESGSVQNTEVQKSSRSEFEQPALEAIRRWKFKPARKDGVAIKMKIQLPMKFSLAGG